jgi:DNA polymerase III alpha subunit
LIPDNLLVKYVKEYEADKKIKTIKSMKDGTVRFPKFLGKVENVMSFTSKKSGKTWTKVKFGDGEDSIEVMMGQQTYEGKKRLFAEGNVLVVPVSFGEEGGRNTCFLSDGKEEIRLLK